MLVVLPRCCVCFCVASRGAFSWTEVGDSLRTPNRIFLYARRLRLFDLVGWAPGFNVFSAEFEDGT